MASERNGIAFWDSDGTEYPYEVFQTNTTDKNFVQVQVKAGTWILYKEKEYNSSSRGEAEYVKMDPGPKPETLQFSPGSFWRAVDEHDSIVVFQLPNYAGLARKVYVEACVDITQEIPSESSVIISPSKSWEVYTMPDYTFGKQTLAPGWYPTSVSMGYPKPDGLARLASIRPV